MTTNLPLLRADLKRRRIEHRDLTDGEVVHLHGAISGWHVRPRTAAKAPAIHARVWLAAALGAGGRYRAPETPGHPADLRDGEPPVDSVVLMAVVQRHFLRTPEPAWDDAALGEQLGLDGRDVARAQAVLDDMQAAVPDARPPLGTGWWRQAPDRGLEASRPR